MASIRERGENTYQFIVSLGLKANGDYDRKYKTYKVTKKMTPKQLEKHLENEAYKFEQEVKSKLYVEVSNINTKDFSDNWMKNHLEDNLSENTLALREGSLKNHILPEIGHLKLNSITTMMLINLMNNLTRKDGREGELSASSKQEVYKALSNMFEKANEWGVLSENPMTGVPYPSEKKNKRTELNVYDKDEISELVNILEGEQAHWRIFITLSFMTGMRRGELLGLEWKHIDLENGVIKVRQIISKTRTGVEVKEPKYNSIRDISISKSLIEDLKLYKKDSEDILSNLGISNRENEWLFFNDDGICLYPDTPTTWWRRFTKRTGIRLIRLHDLRHTSATLLIANNVHAKVISARLGHTKISTTMDIYGHVLPATDKEASDSLDELLKDSHK